MTDFRNHLIKIANDLKIKSNCDLMKAISTITTALRPIIKNQYKFNSDEYEKIMDSLNDEVFNAFNIAFEKRDTFKKILLKHIFSYWDENSKFENTLRKK